MDIELKYGTGKIELHVPEMVEVTILEPQARTPVASVQEALQNALAAIQPCHPSFMQHRNKEFSAAIAIPDETRALPTSEILAGLYDWLLSSIPYLQPGRITIVIGGGLQSQDAQTDISKLVPAHIISNCKIIRHNASKSQVADYGRTSNGTPVYLNQAFASGDYKIVVGQIEPHQIAGFTDSMSGMVIGCSNEATIEHNHSLMFDDNARVGLLHGNPVREDLDEAGRLIDVDFAVDVVLAPNKEVVEILAGPPADNLAKGAKIAADLYGVTLDEKFDIVVAGCGGYPNDISLYTAQKGLHLASQAVKAGGHIFLVTALPQGDGKDIYFDYVSQFTTPEEVLADFRKQEFNMEAPKAYLFGRTFCEFDVAVYSNLDKGILKKCHLRAANPSQVIAEWLESYTDTKKIGVITDAGTTYFRT
ncbi:nickel-dependent lactate racemase [Desulfosediminicola sp.]|uniref:nickel-dependent lactate racemase n=1 Tax=Desulfosediminicola sp. TaxID=2886825 RepID=UPI003AF1EE53